MNKIMCVAVFLYLANYALGAKESKEPNFECRRIREAKLEDIKAAMVKNCNLDKPFSFSVTDIGVQEAVTICCHKVE